MKTRSFALLWGAITVLQAGLLAGVLVLSRLAQAKGGVNHHVAFRKRQYNAIFFTDSKVLMMQILLAVAAALLLLLCLQAIKGRRLRAGVLSGCALLLTILLVVELIHPAFRAIRVYPYAVLATAVAFGLELLLLLLEPKQRSDRNTHTR